MPLSFSKYSDGLIPTIVQHASSGKVLMMGFSNEESLEKTKETRLATFYSRTRKYLWTKGETSGNVLHITAVQYDCDGDTLLFLAIPDGPTCHTGEKSCFWEGEHGKTDAEMLWEVFESIIKSQTDTTEHSYVTSLFAEGLDRIAQKVGEEAVETVIAAKNENQEDFIGEASDLLFHLMVLLVQKGVSLHDIAEKFSKRHQKSTNSLDFSR
ncbi:MAG: bifunctional phosphoribosyl-AMP cyclohydrolase/phosphoribosyl-ATP diphosphatase HisIE [Candidatus Peregrinibacteria bacterium]